ncbi:hypothetical protein GCM10023321_09640 [Pseudonocardia eucalypti]|uniref:Uncharacterized protein n=1 Tax=Pseudonocardia eucalypti TaxID=648755 RepID=A0ABP9PKM3_9PSEU|nr:hypothetical protein [Pseudonocardia eucalypti]
MRQRAWRRWPAIPLLAVLLTLGFGHLAAAAESAESPGPGPGLGGGAAQFVRAPVNTGGELRGLSSAPDSAGTRPASNRQYLTDQNRGAAGWQLLADHEAGARREAGPGRFPASLAASDRHRVSKFADRRRDRAPPLSLG